ncbi:M4 family metallopeptidase [Isorropodon fossajaponicum symbiont]|uniref:M4 family metallopeptidase n=1 Tax=Isorropodon fossajaponicum symbiont TaxID=883811 RepID=UPI001915831D
MRLIVPRPSDYNNLCGVHINSSVANKMFYLLSVGGVHNGVDVTGIGISNAIKIALNANKNHWPRNSTFHAVKVGMISTASGYGDTERWG